MKKVALITGSGRKRVGYVIAKALAKAGYSLVLHYHSSGEEAEQSVAEFRELGTEAIALQADVASESDVDGMFDRAMQHFGRLDVAVTTASIWRTIPFEKTTSEDLIKSYEVNTLGTFLCARRAGLEMCNQPEGGSIVTLGDWSIDRPYVDHAAYFIAKGSIPTLTRMLAVEMAARNPQVRVNCIHPGPVMFPPDATDKEKQSRIDATLVKTADCPETVAHAVKFFTENKFVTGTCLPIDGGRSVAGNEHE
ncbi:SDR family NAD(P)-dependent oxidoreductase [Adhaeretor mobilis]|uniref:Glucose 1-dehydrogenase 2 n=1 Tax=Adhaeretor mobilis TaxID=1930276 RepID=A0A517MZK0_9BACT|nr:SDR family oxidoreductase [Adhaeretor mobilis]QDT00310.1 Glucose 1-dehydrogenase 2 [Adhaeretor mobilis]